MRNLKVTLTIGILILSRSALCAQASDSICINRDDTLSVPQESRSQLLKTIGIVVPAVLITYGAISLESDGLRRLDYSVRDHLVNNHSLWDKHWDDYLHVLPAVTAFGMKFSGVKSTHNTSDMIILYALSNLLNTGIVYSTKHIVARERPDYSNRQSFPSGHTALAFAAAEFLHQEYRDQSVWISVGGYAMASLIGTARVYNNKHWVSDVVAGAGIGILSTKVVYWAYPRLQEIFGKRTKKTNALIFPSYSEGNWDLNLSYSF